MKTKYLLFACVAFGCSVDGGDNSAPIESRAADLAHEAEVSQYTLFEAGQVRPLALDDDRLYALNTPDNRLEVFDVEPDGLQHVASISVGLEPVSVNIEGDQAWVVNHLSDSVSIVDLGAGPRQFSVVRTLLVADEPRDVVFAGSPGDRRAFITTAHRGQNAPYDPELTTPGVGRADVWVFDVDDPGDTLEGLPLTIVSLFTDTPRALTVSADGQTVYAAGFKTGNQTTVVAGGLVGDGNLPPPNTNFEGDPEPLFSNALVVRHDGDHFVDELGRQWDHAINFNLPDKDVFRIDATANPPQIVDEYAHVGTVLFNAISNPVTGAVYVSNTEALNEVRFEGSGVFAGQRGVQGHLHESRITVIDPAEGTVAPRHLNKHVDYSECCDVVGNDEAQRSLAFPTGMEISSDGQTLYVAAFGSSKIGVFDTSQIEDDTFVPDASDHIVVSGGGPSGLVLDEANGRLYALTRFDNSIAVIDPEAKAEVDKVSLYNPEPPTVVAGRPFLYDAFLTSSHGDSACSSCHVFGDFDGLSWDLGNPDDPGDVPNPGPFTINSPEGFLVGQPGGFIDPNFNALKGPMVTQSLRGMANHGSMHWRGDRTGGTLEDPGAQPDTGVFDEDAAFRAFNVAFVGLVGRHEQLPEPDMQSFTDFILQVTYPPNPIRNLDNSLTTSQQAGKEFFTDVDSFLAFPLTCEECHRLDPQGNPDSFRPGFFGSDGRPAFTFQNQIFKNAHMRNLYQKVGMFGFPSIPGIFNPIDHEHMGDQVRGFGFSHDGSVDTVFRFNSLFTFNEDPANPTGIPVNEDGDQIRRDLEAFMLAFDSNLAPIVGQQVTLRHDNLGKVNIRINLLVQRAQASECDLTVKWRLAPQLEVGWLYDGSSKFQSSLSFLGPLPDALLRLIVVASHAPATYTCAPPNNGERIALDRDLDGWRDGDEFILGTDPGDATSHP